MTEQPDDGCHNCEYSGPRVHETVCRFYPPTVIKAGESEWPVVDPQDWCSLWEPTEPQE